MSLETYDHFRVTFHYESGGKVLQPYGWIQAQITLAGSGNRPDTGAMNTVLDKQYPTPSGATRVFDAVANADTAATYG